MSLETEIEKYLLEHGTWVSSQDICAKFAVPDTRALRAIGKRPGLCSDFAISGDKGFLHVECASKKEWLQFKHRLRRHGIAELIRVRRLEFKRHSLVKKLKTITTERDSNQILLGF